MWLLIGSSDVGGLSLACLSVPHVILDARTNILMHVLFRHQSRYRGMPSMDVPGNLSVARGFS